MSLALYPSRVRSNEVLGVIGTIQPDVLCKRVTTEHALHITEKTVRKLLLIGLSEYTKNSASFRKSKGLPGIFPVVAIRTCHEQAKLWIFDLNEAPEIFSDAPLHAPPERRELRGQPLRKRATIDSRVSLLVLAGFDGETGGSSMNLASRLHDA
jgi:hypothetical protein